MLTHDCCFARQQHEAEQEQWKAVAKREIDQLRADNDALVKANEQAKKETEEAKKASKQAASSAAIKREAELNDKVRKLSDNLSKLEIKLAKNENASTTKLYNLQQQVRLAASQPQQDKQPTQPSCLPGGGESAACFLLAFHSRLLAVLVRVCWHCTRVHGPRHVYLAV
jgi:hypothetical protein